MGEGDIIKEKLIVVVGPTAVGKTEISVEVAAHLDGEIISADSMQVYREMNIGTAKIKQEEMISLSRKRIPHHLIDILNPDEDFSVADFQLLVRNLISDINLKGKTPLLVGGTGLYINSIIDPYNFTEQEANLELRNKLYKEAEQWGNYYLYNKLLKVDPETARKFHPNDLRRIVRSLETFYQTGKTISSIQKEHNNQSVYDLVMIGLFYERDILYQRINQRVDKMIEAGLIEEVYQLLKKGYSPHLKSMQGLGYRQIAAYLTGVLTKEEAIYLLKRDTRHFAKRQFTWFKRDRRIKWFNVNDFFKKSLCVEKITEYIGRTMGNSVE
ncbi:MAG: tRNA (adenosine(37)-N6)-dimethylallyltransferase MiaA [Dehalobacterium sp.]